MGPTGVLQGLQAGVSTLPELTRHFVERVIPFNTITSLHGARRTDELIDAARYMRLGWRAEDTKLSRRLPALRETSPKYYFRDERKARAAIMSGGILKRLAIEVVGVDEAFDIVLGGPSEY